MLISLRSLVILTLSVLTILFITLTLTMLTHPLESLQKDDCRGISIIQRYNGWVQGVSLGSSKPLAGFRVNTLKTVERNCPPHVIRISQRTRESLARQIIANEVIRCWNLYGQGKINYAPNTAGNINYCMPCAYITLDKPINGFIDYLLKKQVPGLGISYADYLVGSKTTEQTTPSYPDSLKEGTYVIIFYQDVTGDLWRILTTGDVSAIPAQSGIRGTLASLLGNGRRIITALSRPRGVLSLITKGTGVGSIIGLSIGIISAELDVYAATHPTKASSMILFLPLSSIRKADTGCTQIIQAGAGKD